MLKRFKDLSEKEILAVAISNEEEDGRIYGEFADALRDSYPGDGRKYSKRCAWRRPATATGCWHCSASAFGDHIPPIRREDVRGFLSRRPLWICGRWREGARRQAEIMEMEASRFYSRAASLATDAPTREC